MYLGAQRVIDAAGESTVTLYLYLHGAGVPIRQHNMLRDVRWVSQLAPGQLAREHHEGTVVSGRRVLSYLELSGPDDTDLVSLQKALDALSFHVSVGNKGPMVYEEWGAELFCGADLDRDVEFADLRTKLELFFADGGPVPPEREMTIEVSRDGDVTRFAWDDESRARLIARAPEWAPARLSIHDDVSEAFQDRYGALFPHVLELIQPDGAVDLDAMGGVAFKEKLSRRVLWFSPASRNP